MNETLNIPEASAQINMLSMVNEHCTGSRLLPLVLLAQLQTQLTSEQIAHRLHGYVL